LKIEKIAGEVGEKVSFDEVLLVDDGSKVQLGTPTLKASVSAEVVEQGRAQKVTVIRYRAKSRYFKKNGHRQPFTKVKITGVK
jgi:large subunit ribosomal protein L21